MERGGVSVVAAVERQVKVIISSGNRVAVIDIRDICPGVVEYRGGAEVAAVDRP